jgi:hypothetical protein
VSDQDVPRDAREDEEDHDLLTWTTAGERLREEIADLTERLDQLEGGAARDAERRLAALKEAQGRHGRPSLQDRDLAAFYGKEGS